MRCLISHPKTHESSIAAPFELTSGGSKQKCQMIISSLGIYQNKIRKKSNTTVSTFDIHIHSMYIYISNIYIFYDVWTLSISIISYVVFSKNPHVPWLKNPGLPSAFFPSKVPPDRFATSTIATGNITT